MCARARVCALKLIIPKTRNMYFFPHFRPGNHTQHLYTGNKLKKKKKRERI